MNQKWTTVRVRPGTRDRLRALKKGNVDYDDVIQYLLSERKVLETARSCYDLPAEENSWPQ